MAYDRVARKLQNSKESTAVTSDTKRPSRYAPSKNGMKEGEQSFVQEPNKPLALFKKERGRVYKTYLSSNGNQIVDKNLSVGGNSTFTGNVDINGNIDINGKISASQIYEHTGDTGTKIQFGENTIAFYSDHSNAGGEPSLHVHSSGVTVNNAQEDGIDFRVASGGLDKCLYLDSAYESIQVGGGSALQGSPSGGMFVHNGTTPSAHTDNTVYIGAKDSTAHGTAADGSTVSLFTESGVDSTALDAVGTLSKRIPVWINGTQYWLYLDPV